jgi:hypothetical protein
MKGERVKNLTVRLKQTRFRASARCLSPWGLFWLLVRLFLEPLLWPVILIICVRSINIATSQSWTAVA